MNRKPKVGEKITLYAWTQHSKVGFSIPVECVDAFDRDETILRGQRMLARKCLVTICLPDGSKLDVTREDLEPAE